MRDRPWPPVLRAAAGGAAGWAAIRWGVTEPEPSWAAGSAAAVAAAGGLAAPAVARGAGASVVTGWAAASVLGLYLGVPETDHVVGVAAVITVLVLTSLAAPRQASWLLVAGLDVVLVWAAVRGAPGGGPALAAALAMPGLLVVAPLTSHLPGPRRALAPVSVQPAVLVALQAGFAVVVARNAPSRDTIVEATTLTVAALVVLVLATGWPSGLGRGEAGDRPRRRRHAARRHGAPAGGDRRRRVHRRRPAGAVPSGAERSRRPAVRARQVPHDATSRPRRAPARSTTPIASPASAGSLRSTSLDELPTLVHVVRGEMALVGPRPLPVTYLHRYDDTQARRLEVRPGITGWAQVHGRNTAEMGRPAGPRRLVRRPRAHSPSTPASSPAPSEWSCGGDGIDQAPGVTMTEFEGPGGRAGRSGDRCASPT